MEPFWQGQSEEVDEFAAVMGGKGMPANEVGGKGSGKPAKEEAPADDVYPPINDDGYGVISGERPHGGSGFRGHGNGES
jgi:hypothetical protein